MEGSGGPQGSWPLDGVGAAPIKPALLWAYPAGSPERKSPGCVLGVGVRTLSTTLCDGPVSLAANPEE